MIGQNLSDRYEIADAIGKGAMGAVYRAIDRQSGATVAVKVLAGELQLEPEMVARFRREGEALQQLNHPNIVGYVDTFVHQGQQVIVMEYVNSGSLHELIKRDAPLSLERVRQIALDLCDALTRAHRLDIVHRDLKPENVLLADDGAPKLTDFGVARLVGDATRLTGTGTQIGTPYYMAPEAWEGEQLDAQADIWSLGVVLYEMLSGEVPFGGETLAAVMNKVLTAPLPDLKSLREEVPDGLIQIVARMLTRETTERYQSIREVAADLERGQPLEGSTVSGKQHPKRKAARVPGKEWRGAMLGRRRLSGPALVIATLIALPLLAVVVMAVFNLCPPTGPWPLPPWCPGSQITWPFNTPAAMATATNSATASSITEGTTGAMLFKDLFNDELSPRWVFEPETWARELAAGRTALHNAPSSEASVAKIENTSWEDYSLQFDFRFLQPGSSGMHYFFVRGRMTNCPPTVEALQSYVLTVTPDQSLLEKEPCRSGTRYKIGSNDRDLAEDEWHSLQMRFVGPRIVVLIDGEEYFDYVDTDEPFDSGNFAIETDHDVEFLIDDVQVNEGIAEIARPSAVPLATEEAPDCPPGMELLFFDDFEDGDMVGWDTGPPGGDEQLASADWGWQVENDDLADNHLLVGVGHYHAWREIGAGAWGDFWAQLRLKRLFEDSAAYIVVPGEDAGRYAMNYPEGYVIRDTLVGEATTLVQAQFPSDTGWHDLQLSIVAGRIRVWLDGALLADVTDPEPLAHSRLEFENLGTSDSALWYDDVLVCKVNDAAGLTGTDVGINANELTTLEAHTGAVFDLAWLPNGNRSAAWVTSKPVEIWVTP